MASSPLSPDLALDEADGDGEARSELFRGTGADAPPVYINRIKHAYLGPTFVSSNPPWGGTDSASSAISITEDDYLIILIKNELEQCPEGKEALHSLEQKICDKIRQQKNEPHFSSFKEMFKLSFKEFIAKKPDQFKLDNDGQHYVVYAKKAKKKKRKKKTKNNAQEEIVEASDNPGDWKTFLPETSINDHPREAPVLEERVPGGDEEVEASNTDDSAGWVTVSRKRGSHAREKRLASSVHPSASMTADQVLVLKLVQKPESDRLIFKDSDDAYKRNRPELIKDVTSLYNASDAESPAYILLGVQARLPPPHRLLGVKSSTSEAYYQSVFSKSMFSVVPKFRYREVVCQDKRIGIVEVDNKSSSNSKSVILSDDMAACGLKKNQLWTRERCRNVCHAQAERVGPKPWRAFEENPQKKGTQGKKPPEAQQRSSRTGMISKPPSAKPAQTFHQADTGHSSPGPEPFSKQSCAQAVLESQQQASFASCLKKPPAGAPSKTQELMVALNNFKKFDFVLITGSMCITNSNVQALAAAPWVAVYDFNFHGRDDGLLCLLEEGIAKRRSFSVFTWCDNCRGITEKGTQWWSLRGRREIADSLTPENHKGWFMKVKEKLEKVSQALAQFAEDCTVLKLVILWPNNELEARCMHKFLNKLEENLPLEMILCYPDSSEDHTQSEAAQLFSLEFKDSIKEFHVDLEDFCAEIELLTQGTQAAEKVQFQLPSTDPSCVTLTEKDYAWLAEDLDVLYLQSTCSEALTEDRLEEEAETFFRGGTTKWSTWYDPGYDHFDIKRVLAKDVTSYIEKKFISEFRTGMVTIYHAPGAGGSTMARRVLWDLHSRTPCVHIKQRSGSSVEEIAAKLIFLYDKCRMPVIALMDGEDERRIKQFSRQLQRHNVVIVYVKRYPHSYATKVQGKFYLPGILKKKESKELFSRYVERCKGDLKKVEALRKLDQTVQSEKTVRMYEYGMTVYLHEFQGVRAFVRGHLQLEEQSQGELTQWQKCLGFLALVYYYGQSSLPCQFFVSLLGKMPNYKVDLDDFPNHVKVFVVTDENEGRSICIRIGHYIIAKEILEQILCRRLRTFSGKEVGSTERLSQEARRHLKNFCIEFISQATKRKWKTSLASQTISHVLARTFIFRDNEEACDMDEHRLETQQKKKPQFSQVMSDLDSDPPFQGRLEVLQKLCETFPHDPNFRAHLGRFYTCCRPEDEKEAEKHFQEALRLCREQSQSKDAAETDDKSKLTLMHIYHMYGMFFQFRTDQLIKNCPERHKNENMGDVIVDSAERACEHFGNSRDATPAGHEESYIYTNEIYVRLRTCDFVDRNFPGKLRTVLAQEDDSTPFIKSFVIQSVTEIDNLIMECYDVQVDDVYQLQKYAQWYHSLFSSCSTQLQRLLSSDRLGNLRLTVTATKLKFRQKEDILWTDSPIPEREITEVIRLLEDIFQEEHLDVEDKNKSKVKLDLDYRDWIVAIRHVNFRKGYSVEKVLEHVRIWHEVCRSPQSAYYLFVLLSLLGFGTAAWSGNTECLVEAQMLLEPMQKWSKVIQRSRVPREWLGREDNQGIKRLVTNSNISYEDRRIKNSSRAKLAVCKGTIRAKLQKAAGFIDLDLVACATPVKVFFIPARAENVEPHRDAGARVQFHLAFTLDKGYEAYEVKLLNRYQCFNCPQREEMTWEQQEVECRKCRAIITKNEHSAVSRTPSEELGGH